MNDKTYYSIQYILLCVFAFVMPFSTPNFPYFNLTPTMTALLLLMWLIHGKFSKKFNLLKTNQLLFPFLLFTGLYALYLLGMLYSNDTAFGLNDLFLKLPFLLLPVIILTIQPDYWSKKRILRILQFFVLGNLITLIISIFHSWTLFKIDDCFYHFHYVEASWFHHPSYASMYYCFSFAIIIYLLLHYKTALWEKIAGIFGVILFSTEIVLLDSRAGILSFACVLLIFIFYILFFKRKFILHLLACIVCMSGILLITYKLLPAEMNRIQSTISNIQENNTEVGEYFKEKKDVRLLIWDASFKVGIAHLPFGVGTGDIKEELKKQYMKEEYLEPYAENHNAHSQYLQVFATLGILGIVVLLLILFSPFWTGYKRKNILFILFGVIVGINFVVESMFEKQAGVMFFTFFFLFLYFVSRCQKFKEKENLY